MKLPITIPEGTRFTCQGCGRCCKGWAVTVDQATVDRLRTHDWGGDPFEALTTGDHPYRIRLVGGRCFFLDAQNRCRIHTEISYDAKPPVCRAFPLAILEVAGRQYARLSYWCPTATANTGRLLEQQGRWLKDTAAIAGRRTTALTIDGAREISLRQFDRILGALHRCLTHAALPMRDRLAAGAALMRRLHLTSGPIVDAVAVADRAEAEGMAALAREGASGGHASSGRRVLTLYLLQDRRPGPWSVVPHLASILLFNLGVWRFRSRAIGTRASWRAIRRVAFVTSPPSAATEELLTRYFCSKLESRRFVAGDASLVTGFNLLVAAYAVVEVLARARAAHGGRTACDEEDVRQAVSAADLLVVEHPGLEQSGRHGRLTEAALGGPDLAAGLIDLLSRGR
jgi:lysine-N-methylase